MYEYPYLEIDKKEDQLTTTGDDTVSASEKSYPYLGISKEEQPEKPEEAQVVYFTSECTGIVVISNEFNKKGYMCNYWEQDLFEVCSCEDLAKLIQYKKVLKEIKQKQKYELDKAKREAIESIFQ